MEVDCRFGLSQSKVVNMLGERERKKEGGRFIERFVGNQRDFFD